MKRAVTLQQHKTKIVTAQRFKSVYLRENEKREVDTLSEKFYDLLTQRTLSNTTELPTICGFLCELLMIFVAQLTDH